MQQGMAYRPTLIKHPLARNVGDDSAPQVLYVRGVICDDDGKESVSTLITSTNDYTSIMSGRYQYHDSDTVFKRFDVIYKTKEAAQTAIRVLRHDFNKDFTANDRPTVVMQERNFQPPYSCYMRFDGYGVFDTTKPALVEAMASVYGELHSIMSTHFNNPRMCKSHSVFVNFAQYDSAFKFVQDANKGKIFLNGQRIIVRPQRNLRFVMSLVESLHEQGQTHISLAQARAFKVDKHDMAIDDIAHVLMHVTTQFQYDPTRDVYHFLPLSEPIQIMTMPEQPIKQPRSAKTRPDLSFAQILKTNKFEDGTTNGNPFTENEQEETSSCNEQHEILHVNESDKSRTDMGNELDSKKDELNFKQHKEVLAKHSQSNEFENATHDMQEYTKKPPDLVEDPHSDLSMHEQLVHHNAFWELSHNELCDFFEQADLPAVGIRHSFFNGRDMWSLIHSDNAMQKILAPCPIGLGFQHCLVYNIKMRKAVFEAYGTVIPEHDFRGVLWQPAPFNST